MEDMSPVRLSPEIQPLGNNPACALDASPVYHFAAPNPLGLARVELRGNTLIWENARGRHPLQFGLGENLASEFPGWPVRTMLSSGGWVSADETGICCASAAKSSTMPHAAWICCCDSRALA